MNVAFTRRLNRRKRARANTENRGRRSPWRARRLCAEPLEERTLLDASSVLQSALLAFDGPDLAGKDGPMASLGLELAKLYYEYQEYQDARAGGEFVSGSPLMKVVGDRVLLDVVASADASLVLPALKAIGMEVTATWGSYISGFLPIESLDEIAGLSGIGSTGAAMAIQNGGLTTTQGDVAQRSNLARSNFSVDGSGITVGALSDSYDALGGAAADVASGDLPSGVSVLADMSGSGGTDEGRGMLQLIYDVAPGAALQFHTAFNGIADFAQGIVDLANAGSDVIVDDVIYFAEPMFQDGPIAQAVDQVVSGGVAYFSSAGNQARQSYESAFRNSGESLSSGAGGYLHDFDPAAGSTDLFQRVTIAPYSSMVISFQWDEPFSGSLGPGSSSDIDIYLLSSASTSASVLASSTYGNIGGDPVEVFGYSNSSSSAKTAYVAITKYSGTTPGKIKYVEFYGDTTINEWDTKSGTSYGHANAGGAEAVGAAFYHDTPAFGTSPPTVESFSSAGGVPILFNTSGGRLASPVVRHTPDITAPDGGNTTFFGYDIADPGDGSDLDTYPNFFGTSAAAPHAAAVAALMLDAAGGAGSLTPAQVYSTLESTAVDMDDPGTVGFDSGYDYGTGWGLVDANAAVGAVSGGGGGGAIDVLQVGPKSTMWNDGSFNVTQISVSQFATQNLDGFEAIYVDSEAGGLSTLLSRASAISAFVSAGGGLVTDNGGDWMSPGFSWVPNAGSLGWYTQSDETVQLTALGHTHPVTAGLTDAGLSNWFNSQHNYFTPTAGMDVLATNAAGQANILADEYGSGKLVYFGLDPSFHQPSGETTELIRQAVAWAGAGGGGGGGVVADADGPYVISEGQSLTLDGSGSTASSSATYEWDVDGDGDYDEGITGKTVTLPWAQLQALGLDDGPYTGNVSLRVTDPNAGGTTTELVTNGGFELGNFTGWTIINSGDGGWQINNGSFDPDGPGGPLAPISGSYDAVSYQSAPGLHILTEPIVVPANISSATLSWSDRIRNHAGSFSDPNQEFRVRILNSTGGLIQEVFSTNPGDPLQQLGPNNRSFNVSSLLQSLAGQTIRIKFEQQEDLFFFNTTIDDVSLLVTTGGGGGGGGGGDAIVNGGFETGDFAGWSSAGNTGVVTSSFGSGPTEGTYEALVTTLSGSVSDSQLESFLGLAPGTLDGLGNGDATEGSAIKQTFTAQAGDVLTFDWNFLTNENTPSSWNDFAFVAIVATSELADSGSTFVISPTPYNEETGFRTFTFAIPSSGTYRLGIGAVDVGDTNVDSALLIDNAHVLGLGGGTTTELVTNGGFELGNFTGWTVINSGDGGWQINNGSFDPDGPGGPLAPISGSYDAVSYQSGAGLHVLTEPIVVPASISSATLSWSDRIRNHAGTFSDPNQEFRVRILNSTGGLIQEVFSTNPGDPLQQLGPNNRSFNVTSLMQSLAGQTIRIKFEQQDDQGYFNATIDDVSLLVTTGGGGGGGGGGDAILNGGFETGDFTGWTYTWNGVPQLNPWQVRGPGGGYFGNSAPLGGSFDALNGFDGGAGLVYELYQDVALGSGTSTLSTNHRIVFDGWGIQSSLDRIFEISIRDTNNALLQTLYTQSVTMNGAPYTDLGWSNHVFDVSSYAGSTVRVHFREYIPEAYTGPANIELDNISLITSSGGGGGVDTDTTTLTINNVPPDFEAGPNETLSPSEAGAFSRTGISFTDPGADYWSGTVNFGDGTGDQSLAIDQAAKRFDLNHAYAAEGTFTVTVTVNDDDGGSKTDSFQVEVNLNALTAIDVQKGATQRSYVRYVDLIFENAAGLSDLIADKRVKLTRFGLDGSGGTAVGLGVLSAIGNQIALDFGVQGIGGNRNSNVGDGYYEIALDMDDNGTFETARHFYRLLGNVNADRVVNATDAYAILYAYGKTGAGLEEDANGDGYVNAMDRVLAMRAVGRALAAWLLLDD